MHLKLKLFLSALLFTCTCNAVLAEEQMVFAVDVIRHGDRAPIEAIPNAPWTENLPLGHLSPVGMQQEFHLGEQFRERYICKYHLLPERYSPETMYVRSSDIDRTLMSAECVLLGLYPVGTGPSVGGESALPSSYQPIPIHTRPRNEDSLLVMDFNPKLSSTIAQYVHTTKEWKQKVDNLQPKFKRWNQLTGGNIDTLRGVGGLGDALHIYKLHNVPIPKGLSDADAREIVDETEWIFAACFKPHEIGDLTSHELLKVIHDYFQSATEEKSKLRYVLFSAHDTTIAGMMSVLRDPVDRRPPYSSDLNLALFKDGAQYKVRITFNGKPVEAPGFKNGEGTIKDLEAILEPKTNLSSNVLEISK